MELFMLNLVLPQVVPEPGEMRLTLVLGLARAFYTRGPIHNFLENMGVGWAPKGDEPDESTKGSGPFKPLGRKLKWYQSRGEMRLTLVLGLARAFYTRGPIHIFLENMGIFF